MKFLEDTLHINVQENKIEPDLNLPFYIISRYTIHEAYLNWQEVFFIYPKTDLENIHNLKSLINKLQSVKKNPVIFILKTITARQREAFIKSGIPFVVENKQCYLPFLGTLLTERCDISAKQDEPEKLIPSAQLLLFYFIERNQNILYSKEAATALGFSGMTITRAIRQLKSINLIKTYKDGVSVVIKSEYTNQELFEKAKKYLINPVRKEIIINKENLDDKCIYAGESALSEKSMLNPPNVECYGTYNDSKWQYFDNQELYDEEKQVKLQIWKYNPLILATSTHDSYVDILSLAMSFNNEKDERIEEELDNMLNNYWRNLNGHRN